MRDQLRQGHIPAATLDWFLPLPVQGVTDAQYQVQRGRDSAEKIIHAERMQQTLGETPFLSLRCASPPPRVWLSFFIVSWCASGSYDQFNIPVSPLEPDAVNCLPSPNHVPTDIPLQVLRSPWLWICFCLRILSDCSPWCSSADYNPKYEVRLQRDS